MRYIIVLITLALSGCTTGEVTPYAVPEVKLKIDYGNKLDKKKYQGMLKTIDLVLARDAAELINNYYKSEAIHLNKINDELVKNFAHRLQNSGHVVTTGAIKGRQCSIYADEVDKDIIRLSVTIDNMVFSKLYSYNSTYVNSQYRNWIIAEY